MQVYVKKDCINSSRDYLAANTIATIEESKDAKLINLGLVEEFDVKKHKVSDTKEAKIAELKEANIALEAKIAKLDAFVKAAIALPKGQTPEGYEGI